MPDFLSTNDIRQIFLDYFQEHGHELVNSSSLVPSNDPSLLFTNAGMVPFKDMLLGIERRSYTRAVSSQRCLRVGGKHNDLDNVGYTARHHTFFEMLGNFSFGDYFKEEAIEFSWDLLTNKYKIPAERLWITVHKDDDESEAIWKEKIGLNPQRISRLDDEENFWTMGDTGPCGPCSEIYYDHGAHLIGEPPSMGSDPGDRFIEIWNLVFTQYDRSRDGKLSPLPNPCVDTGMGLERISAVLQNQHNNYTTDLFSVLVTHASKLTKTKDLTNPSLRVISDHLRASAFLIAEGIIPGNEGRGYVLRRIIRRALRHANKLGAQGPILSLMVPTLVQEMGKAHPMLHKNFDLIEANLLQEEEQFEKTLIQGMLLLEEEVKKLKGKTISGELAFKLYDTFGFPVDMTADFARERHLEVDQDSYKVLMLEQRKRARASSNFSSLLPESILIEGKTEFVGYENETCESHILELVTFPEGIQNDVLLEKDEGIIFLKQTPFYAESGGQVGDRGKIIGDDFIFLVKDTQKIGDHFGHIGVVDKGKVKKNEKIKALIDRQLRNKTALNHSATHLLHAALRIILGDHVEQKGSFVDSNRLRFDFTHSKSISKDDLLKIEDLVNDEIFKNTHSVTELMTMENAKRKGAIAFFGDKYGQEVRVLNFGEGFSIELCGGTHVEKTGEIGFMKIISETGVSAGVRRIEALTGANAKDLLLNLHLKIMTLSKEFNLKVDSSVSSLEGKDSLNSIRELQSKISEISKELNTSSDQVVDKVFQIIKDNKVLKDKVGKPTNTKPIIFTQDNKILNAVLKLKNENKNLNQDLGKLKNQNLGSLISEITDRLVEVAGITLIATKLEDLDTVSLRETADQLRSKFPNALVVLISISGDKNPLVVACSKELINIDARDIVKHLVLQLGGSGGGRQDLAQGGVENIDHIDIALASIKDLLRNLTT
ncbi:MAG: alanine--tRNA ligase [SAR86 cluster bacterium]|nr:alanine--tRNA ligase [SAR86 cluster bacterium]